jgi:hypothetical protein
VVTDEKSVTDLSMGGGVAGAVHTVSVIRAALGTSLNVAVYRL